MKHWCITGTYPVADEHTTASMSITVSVSCNDDADVHEVMAGIGAIANAVANEVHEECTPPPTLPHHTNNPEAN